MDLALGAHVDAEKSRCLICSGKIHCGPVAALIYTIEYTGQTLTLDRQIRTNSPRLQGRTINCHRHEAGRESGGDRKNGAFIEGFANVV